LETLGIQHGLEVYDKKHLKCLGGDKGLAKSINILVNLLNPSHYDTNDDGIGFGAWFKKDKHFCMDVYFVMANILLINSNDVTGSGIVIKLKLGMCYLMG